MSGGSDTADGVRSTLEPDQSKLEILRTHPVFGGLDDQELRKVVELCESRCVEAGMLVVREGEVGRELFVISSGEVGVVAGTAGGAARALATLGPGDCFGEMALIDIQRRSASVRATRDTELLVLSARAFREVQRWRLGTYTLIVLNLAREISRRLRQADARIVEMGIPGNLRR